jgi:tetratricopeptide (TPR) repeat protein
MNGQIFISYRRDDAPYPAGRLYDRLVVRLPKNPIFIDVDLDPGIDFVEAIETSVGSCDVLIAVIGKRWLVSSDEEGKNRLQNPADFVRVEIATALKRNIRVIPVLVDGASMPRSSELPDDLKLLARRNALEVSHNRFNADFGRLVAAIGKVLEKAEAERKQHQEANLALAYNTRGGAHLEKKDYDNALSDFNEAIRLDPNFALAYKNRGWVRCEKKEYDKAISDFNEAIRLDPNLALAYNNRGGAHLEKKDYDNALSDFNEAIRLDPNLALAYNNRGWFHIKKRDYDKAISDFDEAIRLDPNFALAYNNRDFAYKSQGKLIKRKPILPKRTT